MLDLYKLKIFVLVTETGSFTKTADALLLSQSAISQHIKSLEQELGTNLFIRGRSGAKLTQAGDTLLGYAQQILDLTATAVNAVTNVANLKEGQLRLGGTIMANNYILPAWIHTFRQQYPNLHVLLQTMEREQIHNGLHTDQLDLGFFTGWELHDDSMLNSQRIQAIDLALIVGKQHPWHDRTQIDLQELDGRSLIMRSPHKPIRQWLDALFIKHQIKPKVGLISDEIEAIKRMIIGGDCVAFLPLCTVSKELSYSDLFALSVPEIQDKPMLTVGWSRKRPFTPISRAFIANLSKTYPALLSLLE